MGMLARATAATLTVFCLATPVYAQNSASIIPDVVYGHKDGMALTFDVFLPPGEPNGAGILNMVSGGWISRWRAPEQARPEYEALLDQGFTVFSVRHGSSPRFNAAEAYGDVNRALRFVRLKASTYGVDPARLGVLRGSTRTTMWCCGLGQHARRSPTGTTYVVCMRRPFLHTARRAC